jgi:uncharacterized protein YlxW (UPF0749 family)
LEPTSEKFYEDLADERADSPLHKWQFPVAIASLILGIAISLQFRSTRSAIPQNPGTRTELLATLKAVEQERDRLRAELTEMRDTRSADVGSGASSGQDTKKELEAARLQAGLTPLKGPGLVIRLSDSPRTPGPEEIPYDFIVHDIDLSVLVNELWASGAEAVTVNDNRIVGRSSIRCVGPTVLVDTNRVASPFIVKAIGDVDHLEGGLKMPGGFLDSMSRLTANGGEVVISRMREVQVPAYQGSLIYRYAAPAEDAAPETAPKAEVGDAR